MDRIKSSICKHLAVDVEEDTSLLCYKIQNHEISRYTKRGSVNYIMVYEKGERNPTFELLYLQKNQQEMVKFTIFMVNLLEHMQIQVAKPIMI